MTKSKETIENKKHPVRKKIAAGVAVAAMSLVGACSTSAEEAPKTPNQTVQIAETPNNAETEQSHSSVDVFWHNETHFNAEIRIESTDSNIGVPADGDGIVQTYDKEVYQSFATADIESDANLSVEINEFRVGDEVLEPATYNEFVKVINQNGHYELIVVHPEQFLGKGSIYVLLTGDSDRPNPQVQSGVHFRMVPIADAPNYRP